MLTEKHNNSKQIYVRFIDYNKAFDRVKHEKLILCLQDIELGGNYIILTRNILETHGNTYK